MSNLAWLAHQLSHRRMGRETARYLRSLAHEPARVSRETTRKLLRTWRNEPGAKVTLGETAWGEPVSVPLNELVQAHGLVTGSTGSGKSRFALLILKSLIESFPQQRTTGFGVYDAKGDLFHGALFLLQQRLERLERDDPQAAKDLRRRIVIYDFSSRDPVSSYNFLARWPKAEPDFFASNRADLLLDLLEGGDGLSLGGTAVLQKLILLLSEFSLPITLLTDVLHDEGLRSRLLARCGNRSVTSYFGRQFASVPKSTLAAIERRVEALFASEGVRLALAGVKAPDFRLFQDESKIVLVNCFGENITRSVRLLVQGLVLSDDRQASFARKRVENDFPKFWDEAQTFFSTAKFRDNMSELMAMSRSFGSHSVYLTQNIATAVQDGRALANVLTNVRWTFSMRGEPSDCAFLKPALPVTGRRVRPEINPFADKSFYSLNEERALALDEVAHLPNRVGYLWFKGHAPEAIRLRTRDLEMPRGRELYQATLAIKRDPGVGMRLSRREYERLIAERDREWLESDAESSLRDRLEERYRRERGA